MKLQRLGTAAALLVVLALPLTAYAGGKHGSNGSNGAATASCSASAGSVQASGLPTDQVVNFMVQTASGTTGWVLGYTSDGTFTVAVPTAAAGTTYEFVSRTWGPDGSKYNVFTSCSA